MDKLFKPQINSKSDKIAQLKNYEQNQKPVSERLYSNAQERVNKLISSSTQDERHCTFNPVFCQQQSQSNDF